MRLICAWCGATISDDGDPGPASHGMCDECAVREELSLWISTALRPALLDAPESVLLSLSREVEGTEAHDYITLAAAAELARRRRGR